MQWQTLRRDQIDVGIPRISAGSSKTSRSKFDGSAIRNRTAFVTATSSANRLRSRRDIWRIVSPGWGNRYLRGEPSPAMVTNIS
jgi:hypothetical protein